MCQASTQLQHREVCEWQMHGAAQKKKGRLEGLEGVRGRAFWGVVIVYGALSRLGMLPVSSYPDRSHLIAIESTCHHWINSSYSRPQRGPAPCLDPPSRVDA